MKREWKGHPMPTRTISNRTFDARPDRIDLRDRAYLPKLLSLPPVWPAAEQIRNYLPAYAKTLILDQGQEGACTGLGLGGGVK